MDKKLKTIKVKICLSDDVFIKLALMAHESDMTFNEFVNRILRERILKEAKKQ